MNNKRVPYLILVRPILTYSAQILETTNKPNYLRLQKPQNKIMRTILNKIRNPETKHYYPTKIMHEGINIPLLSEYKTKKHTKFALNSSKLKRKIIRKIYKIPFTL